MGSCPFQTLVSSLVREAVLLTSASVSRKYSVYRLEVLFAALVQLVTLGNVTLLIFFIPPSSLV